MPLVDTYHTCQKVCRVNLSQMKPTRYIIEIYDPRDGDVWVSFESSTPFGSINQGDILNPGSWSADVKPDLRLRVINIEHLLWQSEKGVAHKVCIYTEIMEVSKPQEFFFNIR